MRRLRPALLLAAALLAGGLAAGCTTANTGTGTTAATESAKTELHNAVQKLTSTTTKLNMQVSAETGSNATTNINISGGLDPQGDKSSLTIGVQTLSFEFRSLPDAIYVRFSGGAVLPGLPTGWMKLDKGRLPNSLNDALRPDSAMGVDKLIDAISMATKTGNDYAGTIDVTKAAGSLGLPSAVVSQIPQEDRTVPFTATIDGQGNLTKFSFSPKINGSTTSTTLMYSDFGQPVTVDSPPANEVSDAPDLLYTALGALG